MSTKRPPASNGNLAFPTGPDEVVQTVRRDFARRTAHLRAIATGILGSLFFMLVTVRSAHSTPLYQLVTLPSSVEAMNEAGQAMGTADRYDNDGNRAGLTAWLYNGSATIDIGLTGVEHTRGDGFKAIYSQELNDAGQVRGYSWRYGSFDSGQSAWLYNGTTTIDIGLTDAAFTRDDGYKFSDSVGMNEAGQVIGRSNRFTGSTLMGRTAWLYNGTTTIPIGLTGPEYVGADGATFNSPIAMNASGQVAGTSLLHFSELGVGSRFGAWLYDGTTTVGIGLANPENIHPDGYHNMAIDDINNAGQVIGVSARYSPTGADAGASQWLYGNGVTTEIGLLGTEFTRNDGYRNNDAQQLNDAGYVRGFAERYNGGSTGTGLSVWLYNGSTTVNIGLTGPEYTHSNGSQTSFSDGMNAAGQVRGRSRRYNGTTTDLGQTGWLYNGTTTVELGLTGPAYLRNDGYKFSEARVLNEAGEIAGLSFRFGVDGKFLGRSAWFYDGADTVEIGLAGDEFTRSNGETDNWAQKLNEAGQVAGYTFRWKGGGQTAWFYDPTLNQTIPLNLSTRSDGYARSSVDYLGEDGLVLGTYQLFDAQDHDLGTRAFYFTAADGLHDLGSLVVNGLAAYGLATISSPRANGAGQISGSASSLSGESLGYLLTHAPEPNSIVLVGCALLGFTGCSRWRKGSRHSMK